MTCCAAEHAIDVANPDNEDQAADPKTAGCDRCILMLSLQ
jgi:hypothetical protein